MKRPTCCTTISRTVGNLDDQRRPYHADAVVKHSVDDSAKGLLSGLATVPCTTRHAGRRPTSRTDPFLGGDSCLATGMPSLAGMTTSHALQFYIDGQWINASGTRTHDVINPATEQVVATIALGEQADVDRAVAAAKAASESFSQTTKEERLALLGKIMDAYKARLGDIASAVSSEMGAPLTLAQRAQAPAGLGHLMATAKALESLEFAEDIGTSRIEYEPIGVCALITPWNWPLNQIAAKVAPAIAAGCTMVLKPSEMAPLNALIFAEVMHEAGVPKGVFNLVNGDGPTVGAALFVAS